jgi:hypothetical protein
MDGMEKTGGISIERRQKPSFVRLCIEETRPLEPISGIKKRRYDETDFRKFN